MRVALGGTLYFSVRTKDGSRSPTAPAGAPTYATYRGDVDAGMTGGSGTMTVNASVNTLFRGSIVCSGANGFASGNSYTIVVDYSTGGTARCEEITFYVD